MTVLNEIEDRLSIISEMIDDFLEKGNMLVGTQSFLSDLQSVAGVEKKVDELKVILSTGSTVAKEGYAVVSWVVDEPREGGLKKEAFDKAIPSKTLDQAGYDAVYEALVSFFSIVNNPEVPVEVHSDNQTIVRQLNAEISCPVKLLNKRTNIMELVAELPVEIRFIWKPYCSTEGMKLAKETIYI